ncbi:hypothetical protein CIK05_02375 [Bdellovibrio sp. qaytius]|nr:hypothetical protein CIK05_02375 [Bdellovibrio sp. qaytius]
MLFKSVLGVAFSFSLLSSFTSAAAPTHVFNATSECGYSDWQYIVFKDVTNTVCEWTETDIFTILKISGNNIFLEKPVGDGLDNGITENTH